MPESPRIPPAPDPSVTTQAQTASNLATLHATQTAQSVNQDTPYGTLNYSISGTDPEGNPIWNAESQLSPDQQQILDYLQGSQKSLGGTGNQLADNSSNLYSTPPDFSEAAGTQTKINMDRQLAYLTPYFRQQNDQLDNQLRNQGLTPGTEAYDRAMRTMRDNQNQSVFSFLNQTQPIAYDQAQKQYNQPLQTLSGILGLTQPASLAQQFVGTPKPSMSPTDVAGITSSAYSNSLEKYKAQLAAQNSVVSGVMGIGKAALPLLI